MIESAAVVFMPPVALTGVLAARTTIATDNSASLNEGPRGSSDFLAPNSSPSSGMARFAKTVSRHDNCDGYILGPAIGFGAFGAVHRVTRKIDHKSFACKFCISNHVLDEELRALTYLRTNSYQNIVEIIEITRLCNKTAIIMELLEGGEVFKRIEKTGGFSERAAASVIKDLMQALSALTAAGIIHRDIKTENLVYCTDDPDSHVKLIDFGLAVQVPDVNNSIRLGRKPVGSPMYLAPETINHCVYSSKTDIWSAGVSLYVLLVADNPFDNDSNAIRNKQISQGNYHSLQSDLWRHISEDAKDLVASMLSFNPADRPSAEQILQHRWIVANTSPIPETISPTDFTVASPHQIQSIPTESAEMLTSPFTAEYMARVRAKLARERLRRAILCVRWTCGAKFLKKKEVGTPSESVVSSVSTEDNCPCISVSEQHDNINKPPEVVPMVEFDRNVVLDDVAPYNEESIFHLEPSSNSVDSDIVTDAEQAAYLSFCLQSPTDIDNIIDEFECGSKVSNEYGSDVLEDEDDDKCCDAFEVTSNVTSGTVGVSDAAVEFIEDKEVKSLCSNDEDSVLPVNQDESLRIVLKRTLSATERECVDIAVKSEAEYESAETEVREKKRSKVEDDSDRPNQKGFFQSCVLC